MNHLFLFISYQETDVQLFSISWYSLGDTIVDFYIDMGIFFFATASEPALGPAQPPIQWVLVTLSLGVKRPGREADHSPPSSAEVKNAWSYTPTSPVCFQGMVLS
jgi:hypothetical protein